MADIQPSPEMPPADVPVIEASTANDAQHPPTGKLSPVTPDSPDVDIKTSDPHSATGAASAQPLLKTSAPSTPPPELAEAESDVVAPLPSASDEAVLRTDKSLKRKSRDSVFFASGDVTEDDPYKKAKDDPDSKSKSTEQNRPVPSTPPRAKSPNKFVSTLDHMLR